MAETKKFRSSLTVYLPFLLILIFGFLSSFAIYYWKQADEIETVENEFNLLANEIVESFKLELESNLFVVNAVEAFFNSSEYVERHEFQEFAAEFLKNYPSIKALRWAVPVTLHQRTSFVNEMRQKGPPDFQILELNSESILQHAEDRNIYYPIIFSEPAKEAEQIIGFDLGSEKSRHDSLQESLHKRLATATPPLHFLKDGMAEPEVLVFHPVWQKTGRVLRKTPGNLLGIITAVYVPRTLFETAPPLLTRNDIRLSVMDITEETQALLLYQYDSEQKPDQRSFQKMKQNMKIQGMNRNIVFAERTWRFSLMPTSKFIQRYSSEQPSLFLMAGLLLTVIVAHYFWNYTQRAAFVEQEVLYRTSELRKTKADLELEIQEHQITEHKLSDSEEMWRALIENAPDFILVTDLAGKIIFLNRTSPVPGLTVNQFTGRYVFDFGDPRYLDEVRTKIHRAAETGERQEYDIPVHFGDDITIWYRSHVGVIYSGKTISNLVIVASDITKEKQIEEEILRAKDFLNKIINAVADPIFVKDRQHRWVLLNDAYCQLMGYERDQLLGKSDVDFFPKEQVEVFWEKDELVFQTGQNNVNEELFTDKQGVVHTISTKKTIYRDPLGNAYIVGIIRDVSEEKEIQSIIRESEQKYMDLFYNAPDPIIRLDAAGHFESVNPAAEKIIGLTESELTGRPFPEIPILNAESMLRIKAEFERLANGEEVPPMEITVIRDKENPRIFEANPTAIQRDDKMVGVQVIFRDITERKKHEEIDLKSSFISMVSHELRTPIHTIKEGLSVLLDGSVGNISPEQKDFLMIIQRNVSRLARLINNVLDFQKLDGRQMRLFYDQHSIGDLVQEVSDLMQNLVKSEGLRLKLQLDSDIPKFRFDRDRIMQVLINLLDNAIKFTKEGTILVKTIIQNGEVKVVVKDTGIGIQADDAPKLFHDFSQLRAGSEKRVSGTGLGLAISKKIIELHHGHIGVESTAGAGSEFWFTLPMKGLSS